MHGCSVFALWATIGISVWCGALDAAEIRLRPAAQCDSRLIVLGDVAEVFATEHEEMQRLSAVELFPGPAVGEKRFVDIREIRDLLAIKGINLANITFSGASQVVIRGQAEIVASVAQPTINDAARRVATQRVTEALVGYLSDHAGETKRWNVKIELNDQQTEALAGTSSLEISGGAQPWVGRQTFRVVDRQATGEYATTIEAEVTLPAMIVVATRTLPRGAVVHAADLQVQATRPHEAQLESFGRVEDVVGQELRRSIGAGQVLTQGDLRPPILVRRGDPVTVYARSPGIQVRTTARAAEDGALGDLITVESLSDRKRFFASVSGIQEVEIYARAAAAGSVRPVAALETPATNFRGP